MPRLLAALQLVSFLCLPASATAIVISFGGDVDGVVDLDGRLDGSVVIGTRVTGTYEVDPTPTGSDGEVGAARLRFELGSYRFDQSQDPHQISLIDDRAVGPAQVDIWQSRDIVALQLDPAIPQVPEGVGYAAGLQLFDFDATELDGSEVAPFVVGDLVGWETARLTLNALVSDLEGGVEIGRLQIQVDLDTWQVVPEPGSGALLAAGMAWLCARRRESGRR